MALNAKKLTSNSPPFRAAAQAALRHSQKDADLASIRDPDALAKLSPAERDAFIQLWADVAALLKQTEEKTK